MCVNCGPGSVGSASVVEAVWLADFEGSFASDGGPLARRSARPGLNLPASLPPTGGLLACKRPGALVSFTRADVGLSAAKDDVSFASEDGETIDPEIEPFRIKVCLLASASGKDVSCPALLDDLLTPLPSAWTCLKSSFFFNIA